MRTNTMKATLNTVVRVACLLLFGATVAMGQQQVNLSAGPATATLPDGSAVPMWGYTCGAAASGSSATCAALNPAVAAGSWSPVVITVPTGQGLQINLTNNLTFAGGGVPTSIVIVGQVGGGLGDATQRTITAPPDHSNAQPLTWPIAADAPGAPLTGVGTPPVQGPRVQSFSTEVAAGTTANLTWSSLRPGTYLIESGTHPSIQGPMGLYGVLVVTTAPSGAVAGTAYPAPNTTTPAVSYSAEIPMVFSEIDPVQNAAVNAAVNTTGFSETAVWSGKAGACGDPTVHSCYPPAVNYTPLYYLINGVAFDKTNPAGSVFAAAPTGVTSGTVLVRLVNAGLRMHVPSIVGAQTTPAVVASGLTAAATSGFSLVAEDGNPVPGVSRIQSEVFMAAGKTYDVMINLPATGAPALPIFDRELSLSANGSARDAGMLAYIGVNGATTSAPAATSSLGTIQTYYCIPGVTLSIADPAQGVLAGATNIDGVVLSTSKLANATDSIALSPNGTFTYAQVGTNKSCGGMFTFAVNGKTTTGTATIAQCNTSTTCETGAPTANNDTYTSPVASFLHVGAPGVLANDTDPAGHPLSAINLTGMTGGTVTLNPDGSFSAVPATAPTAGQTAQVSFQYTAQNSQKTSSAAATVTITFNGGSGLNVTVLDGKDLKTTISDYRWIIEEDRTFYVNPKCTQNPPPSGCPTATYQGLGTTGIVPTFGTNFHTSSMPVVATGCTGPLSCESGQTMVDPSTGNHVPAVCDVGNGACRVDTTGAGFTATLPSSVQLDPTKRYYISVLPGDAASPFIGANLSAPTNCAKGPYNTDGSLNTDCGHGMGGAPVACIPAAGAVQCSSTDSFPAVTVVSEPTPLPPAKLSVFVFEDDFPLNGEHDASGGIDILAPNEPGLGSFQITLFDDAGGTGDATGQPTYDMFNQPLSNSLAGTIDPATQLDACPVSSEITSNMLTPGANQGAIAGITGMIVTCPKYESDGLTLSPLAGQAVIANLYPGRYGVVATPNADRIARGEEWLQTNTLDGQKAHDSFLRVGEPSYFQEFGPASWHVTIGFASPTVINARKAGVCGGTDPNITGSNCNHTVTGIVTTERMSRTPDERLYSSGDNSSFSFTQCFVSLGDTDGEDFAFTKCASDGSFTLSGIPDGNWRITVFDQWNDMLVDGLSTPVGLGPGYGLCTGQGSTSSTCNMGQIAMNQWQANIYTTTFFDANGNGVRDGNESGLALVSTNIRFRDGSYSNFNNTDLNGYAGFNEVFPLFSWYVVEADTTRYKSTGTHVVYDAGGPSDGTPGGGTSTIAQFKANTTEQIPVPANLRVPGAFYCATADCSDAPAPLAPGGSGGTTGRVDPAIPHPYGATYGWQGFSGQNSFLEFGKKPFAPGENGGIHGHVVYASTRPFDDPSLLLQLSWEPLVPGVTVNLYQETTAADGTKALKLADTTTTSSWDDWAQGFRTDGVPNMNCPGQGRDTGTNADLFFFSLYNQPNYLDFYNSLHGGPAPTALPANSQFKCYDGMHNWNQLQPAPYDGMYRFPSITSINPSTGKPAGTNCSICTGTDSDGNPMLPTGTYVVEIVVPSGYELVKEEDKNILIGDNYIAPATVQFPGLGSAIYILPDQAAIGATYNPYNSQNPTQDLGRPTLPQGEGDTGSVEQFWPCVGASRIVPDYISLYPQSQEVAPFAGATRNLCDRKEVIVSDQASSLAKFYIFTSTHKAAHFTGVITDDFTSEFDPFSPQFGEKFSPANMPISFKDWNGIEVSRVYSDQWGTYNGLTYSSWEVNPPNPTGYAPTMMVTCMNDPGNGPSPDPLFNPQYSQFCYEIPFMPGQTQYMDTPVVPTSAFAGAGYNNPDCDYADGTPAIKEVDGDAIGPYVKTSGARTITITSLGSQSVFNYGYSGPSATTAPYNQKTVTRNYGFGGQPSNCPTIGACPNVTVGGVPLQNVSWSDEKISGTVPTTIPRCFAQMSQYGGDQNTRCGQLVITAANGKQSIDSITVTMENKAPTHVLANGTIQAAIDGAHPGDLIIVDPGVHNELVLMWKPVRLQGVGAVSSIINANTHPAGKLDAWRARVNCLFGLALNGQPYSTPGHLVPEPGFETPGDPNFGKSEPLNPYDPSNTYTCGGWTDFNGSPNNPQVDRIPLEGILGWDTLVNGNLAQLLQEPSLMGAYEGAGITVLAKGVRYPAGVEIFGGGKDTAAGSNIAHEGQFPETSTQGTNLLTNRAADCSTSGNVTTGYSSNFLCNPSRIDGLSVTDASQGGGGIFVHGWAHKLEISNDRVYNNTGTLTGGIVIGQGESPDALIAGNNGDPLAGNGGYGGFDQQPWTCLPGAVTFNNGGNGILGAQNASFTSVGIPDGAEVPFCYNVGVNVHNNYVTRNSSIGDEVFSGTPAGAGGVSFCTGSDYYKFNYNWVCGNLSTGDGGGVAHIGFSYNGDIEHNTIVFNQSTNPTIPTNGGGLIIMGAAPDSNSAALGGAECGAVTDVDCAPGLSDGTGPNLVVNANLIMGNGAESGSGGGLRLQDVNGTEVPVFPNGSTTVTRADVAPMYGGPTPPGNSRFTTSTSWTRWNNVQVTNNIIVNNVAGWDGGGVSMQDSLAVRFINNTVASNDSTASAGPLFNTLGAPNASAPGCTGGSNSNATNCTNSGATASSPQVAGLVTMQNTAGLRGVLSGVSVTCPSGNGTGTNCRNFSVPDMYNNLFWQNRSFYIGVGSLGTGTENQQNVVALYAMSGTPAPSQAVTGGCPTGVSYWDIGGRGDTGPGNHASGVTLSPNYSVLTSSSEAGNGTNVLAGTNPELVSQYCNGSRVPPENGGLGYNVPAGISDATVPNPIFNLTPTATVDEGNNWINISWGPLALVNPATTAVLGNYALRSTSRAINAGESGSSGIGFPPSTDYFGNPRPSGGGYDIGAVEFQGTRSTTLSVTPTSLAFGNVTLHSTSPVQTLTLESGTAATNINIVVTAPFARSGGNCPTATPNVLAANSSCTINIVYSPTTAAASTGTVTITAATGGPVAGSPVALTGTGVAQVSVTPTVLSFGSVQAGQVSPAQFVTLTNGTTAAINTIAVAFSSTTQFSGTTGGTCGTALGAGLSCTIGVVFHPTTSGGQSAELTITSSATVVGSPVALEGTGFIPTASVSPASLAFGNWATGLTSPSQMVTVTNTGTSTLTGGTFTATAPFHVIGTGTTCGGTLAVGGSCTVAVDFAPTAAVASNGTLTVAYTGATVTPPTVTLTGTGVATRATVSVSPNPLTITLSSGTITGTGTVTLTNTAPATGSQMTVTNVAVSGGSPVTYIFNAVLGQDHCTNATLAPGASCTVGVRFTNVLSPRGVNRAGTITFTDNATGSPQTGNLVGHAN
ncbi:MAG TPA: choice-of-anchor D domain-containing protein [Verrucomicrobiae bacterium]|nr:choice-of-anchor D domain-containing protein [Verrucomicrobiae bacterium]